MYDTEKETLKDKIHKLMNELAQNEREKDNTKDAMQNSLKEVNHLYGQKVDYLQKELLETRTEANTRLIVLTSDLNEAQKALKKSEETILNLKKKLRESKYQYEISQKAASYRLEKSEKRANEVDKYQEENKKLKKDLKTAKVRLRSTSKEKQFAESSASKCGLASKLLGFSEAQNSSSKRDRSQTEYNCSSTNKTDVNSVEYQEIKIRILQNTIYNVVKENAMLRLKMEEMDTLETDHNKEKERLNLATRIANKELKILKLFRECTKKVTCSLCSNSMSPNFFYQHECILALAGNNDPVLEDIQKDAEKILFKEYSTASIDMKDSIIKTEKISNHDRNFPKCVSPIDKKTEHANEYLDAPFFNNLVLESDTEGVNIDSHDLTDEGILKRLKTDNSSYYQTNNLKSVIPNSCQLNYETTRISDKSKKTGKKSLGRRGSLPRDTKNSKKIDTSKRSCKSRNKNNEFTRVLSERILETTGKSRLNGTRSKVAKLNLYPSMIESKMINQFAHMKNSPSKHHKRTRNNSEFRSMNSNDTRNKTAKTCKTQKKLITSLKN